MSPSADERLAALLRLFPEAAADGQVDLGQIARALGSAARLPEPYGLTWPGRQRAAQRAEKPPQGAIHPWPAQAHHPEEALHSVLEGDNLTLLRLLQPAYAERVQLIFLDPPYNTGRDLAYADHFREHARDYSARTPLQGDRDGRLHAPWLSFMLPRLLLCRDLLAPTGFLVATIDDREVAPLRLLLDSVFGAEGFIAHAAWQKAYVANQTARHLSNTHDHVLIYARDPRRARSGRLPRSPEQLAAFRNPDDDPRGPWKAENLSAGKPYSQGRFVITTPSGKQVHPPPGRWWRCSEARYQQWLAEGRIWFGREDRGRPMLKKYLSEVRPGLTPDTWWSHQSCGSSKEASTRLKALFDGHAVFETPKPVRLMRRIVDLFSPEGGILLDPFAGSGSTGHAALQATAEDGHPRPTLLIQRPEPLRAPVRRAFPQLQSLTDLCCERLRRAARSMDLPLGMRTWREGPAPAPPPAQPWEAAGHGLAEGIALHAQVCRTPGGWRLDDGDRHVEIPGEIRPAGHNTDPRHLADSRDPTC